MLAVLAILFLIRAHPRLSAVKIVFSCAARLPGVSITEVTGLLKKLAGNGLLTRYCVGQRGTQAMHHHPQPASAFTLKPGERITDCSPLWTSGSDRVQEEIAKCSHCLQPTYRVIVITSAAGLERRASLCLQHFVYAARTFPELRRQSA
jgi:hypothetical protein